MSYVRQLYCATDRKIRGREWYFPICIERTTGWRESGRLSTSDVLWLAGRLDRCIGLPLGSSFDDDVFIQSFSDKATTGPSGSPVEPEGESTPVSLLTTTFSVTNLHGELRPRDLPSCTSDREHWHMHKQLKRTPWGCSLSIAHYPLANKSTQKRRSPCPPTTSFAPGRTPRFAAASLRQNVRHFLQTPLAQSNFRTLISGKSLADS